MRVDRPFLLTSNAIHEITRNHTNETLQANRVLTESLPQGSTDFIQARL
jgi:hypothetical protein